MTSLFLLILLVAYGSTVSSIVVTRTRMTRTKMRATTLGTIPEELTATDSFMETFAFPQTSIETIEGGENLGTLLFAFILYQGLSNSVLPVVAKVLNCEMQDWYRDAKDGFAFDTPPAVEMVRVLLFLSSAYYLNKFWISLFGGDSFWGWATAGALAIPTALFSAVAAQDKKPTRSAFDFQEKMKENFREFALRRISRNVDEECTEQRIINVFRRNFQEYRDESLVTEKQIKIAIRSLLGKPNKEGIYKGVAIIGKSQRQAQIDVQLKIKELQEQAKLLKDEKNDDEDEIFVNDFTRL